MNQRVNIEAERGRLQLSKTEMCKHLGITTKTYNSYIHGGMIPSTALEKLRDMTGKTIDYLLGLSNEKDASLRWSDEMINPYFNDLGDISVVPWYEGNEIYCREVRFAVPAEEWNEFESSQIFSDLVQYQQDLQKRIQDMRTERREQEYRSESPVSTEIQKTQSHHGSVCARVRNRCHDILSR